MELKSIKRIVLKAHFRKKYFLVLTLMSNRFNGVQKKFKNDSVIANEKILIININSVQHTKLYLSKDTQRGRHYLI